MKNPWKTLSSESKYKNPWIEVIEHKVIHPNGKEGIYGEVRAIPAVIVIAFDEIENSIYLFKEFKYLINTEIWATATGGIHPGETPEEIAVEELREEMNLKSDEIISLGTAFISPGHDSTVLYMFYAKKLSELDGKDRGEGNEIIGKLQKFSIDQIKKMIVNNEIKNCLLLSALNVFLSSNFSKISS